MSDCMDLGFSLVVSSSRYYRKYSMIFSQIIFTAPRVCCLDFLNLIDVCRSFSPKFILFLKFQCVWNCCLHLMSLNSCTGRKAEESFHIFLLQDTCSIALLFGFFFYFLILKSLTYFLILQQYHMLDFPCRPFCELLSSSVLLFEMGNQDCMLY